ncbi:MAG: hypothetical protein KatS3mg061_0794 [Dehalococcoidia bacterium]|nr:MAG: hypothetical protein KatS3mg061_0794 [Dehalococcoidia bacterium]
MRIFQVIEASTNSALPQSQIWLWKLYEPLVEMGHEVVLFPAEEGIQAWLTNNAALRERFSERLWTTLKQEHQRVPFDLFFAYLRDGMVLPEVIDAINQLGVPTCNFSCNNAHQFHLVQEISRHFTYSLHSERDCREKFLQVGARPIWFQMAANPRRYAPQPVPRTVPVSFVGMNYALRSEYILYLLEQGVEVHVYGPGWLPASSGWLPRRWMKRQLLLLRALLAPSVERQVERSADLWRYELTRLLFHRYRRYLHPPIDDQAMVRLYSASQISLGFLEVFEGHNPRRAVVQHLHLREFEAPMAGALYCTNYSDELAEHFEPDREVLVFRNRYELLDKVRYYLTHPEEAEAIRQRGRARALRDHTWQVRFQHLFRQIGLAA